MNTETNKIEIKNIELNNSISIDGYILNSKLGAGTYGEVWKVSKDNNCYALKLLRGAGEVDSKRFDTESKLMAKMKGANIPEFYDKGFYEGYPYIVIELIEGATIEEVLEFGDVFQETEIAELLLSLATTLDGIWNSMQMMHRDIKPENIIIKEDKTPVLMDFGIAKIAGVTPDLTMTGTVVGTPNFMSPEQALGEKESIDCRTDIYSLGATAYFMAIGQKPKNSSSMSQIIKNIVYKSYPSITDKFPDFSKELATIIRKMTRRELSDRYQSWQELIVDLNHFLKGTHHKIKINIEESQFLSIDDFEEVDLNKKGSSTIQILIFTIIILIIITILI